MRWINLLSSASAAFVFGSASPMGKEERWANDPSDNVPSGYVTTNGQEFWLDHKPFYFVGNNAYWIPQLVYENQYDQFFQETVAVGAKVMRTWAFSDIVGELPTDTLTYYQYWVNGTAFLNFGSSGLERLDMTVKYAEKYDVKLILSNCLRAALTNNWEAYGGIDTYINESTVTNTSIHTSFFTYQPIIDAYQAYATNIVNRYKNSSAIFAWELCNEPRANGYPTVAAPNFTDAELTTWFDNQSTFIKSLDSYHMVCIGDEGYYNNSYNTSDYIYNGQSGMNFDANLALTNIDFGTFHLYPQSWAEYYPSMEQWGLTYIDQHIQSGKVANKPVVLEEFGLTGYDNQTEIYPSWFNACISGGCAGIMPWALGAEGLNITGTTVYVGGVNGGNDTLDNYDIHPNKTDIWELCQNASKQMDAKNQ